MSPHPRLSRRQLLKSAATLGLGLAAATALSACQPKSSAPGSGEISKGQAPEAKSDETIPELRFLTRVGSLGLFMKEYARLYVEKNPLEVKVKLEEGNWDDISVKLMTSAVAGTLADIFWQPYFYLPYNIANGVMAELDDAAAASGLDMSIWYPWALETQKLNGKLYGIPLGVMPGWNEIIYNRDLLEEAGVEPQSWPNKQTWAELIEDCKKIKDKTGAWGICMNNWWWGQEMIHRNFDGRLVEWMGDESHWLDENVQEAAKLCYDMTMTHGVEPTTASLEGDRNKMFLAGKVGMMINCAADIVCGWAEMIGGKFRYGYTSIPQGDRGLWGTSTWADSVNIYANSKHPDIAFKICAEIGGVDASVWTCLTTGMTPGACPAAWEDPRVAEKYPLYGWEGEWFKSNAPELAPMPYNYRFNEFSTLFNAEWLPVKNGERDYNAKELNDMNNKFNEVLKNPRPA